MRKKLCNQKDFPPKCEYCVHGRLSPDGRSILCDKKGVIPEDSVCRSYKYDPLKRTPMPKLTVSKADPDDFRL